MQYCYDDVRHYDAQTLQTMWSKFDNVMQLDHSLDFYQLEDYDHCYVQYFHDLVTVIVIGLFVVTLAG